MILLELLTFVISSGITFSLSFAKVPNNILMRIVGVLLVALLILLNKFIFNRANKKLGTLTRTLVLFTSALFTQLLVLSSGGLFSPFLILVHLYSLGLSFLLNVSTSIAFLILSLAVLITNILFNPALYATFVQDPWSVALYITSFIVIIPLALVLTKNYHLKDALSKILKDYIQESEKREESILGGLNEMVVVTDKNLRIISANEAVERGLNLQAEDIYNKNFFEILEIEDASENRASSDTLAIDKIGQDKVTRIIEGMFLKSPTQGKIRISIQIKPVTDQAGAISQIVFVITDPDLNSSLQRHTNLEQAKVHQKILLNNFRRSITAVQNRALSTQMELYLKTEDDLLSALEIEDHPIKALIHFADVALVSQQLVESKQGLATSLKVNLSFKILGDSAETSLLSLQNSNLPKEALPISNYSTPVDVKWFSLILTKLIEMSMLISCGEANASVAVNIGRTRSNIIFIEIVSSHQFLNAQDDQDLFTEYYGQMGVKTNLKLGSGLEGFIVKNVANQLGVSVEVKKDTPTLVLLLQLAKPVVAQ